MNVSIKTSVFLLMLGAAGAAARFPLNSYWKASHRPEYRHAQVTRGPLVAIVNATGSVQPASLVSVGASPSISGPVVHVGVDCTDTVKKGQLLAKLDPRPYEVAVARDRSTLAAKNAEQKRVEALLEQAERDLARAMALRHENKEFISDADMDQYKFSHLALKAQLEESKRSVDVAQASLTISLANLESTEIRSPVDGVILERKIHQGQTVAQGQPPELFVIAPEMQTIHVVASVAEADIGLAREAQRRKLRVQFTVDAYPGELFEGTILQIGMKATTTQNSAAYPIVIKASNSALEPMPGADEAKVSWKFLPGMTADVRFSLNMGGSVLRISNAALRFSPRTEQMRPIDRVLLGNGEGIAASSDTASVNRSAVAKGTARRGHNRQYVWTDEGDYLRAVPVVTGMSDNEHTQLVSGELTEGESLVTEAESAQD